MDCVYDDRFGTFAFGDNRMRQKLQVQNRTHSLFNYVQSIARSSFLNRGYNPSDAFLDVNRAATSCWTSYLLRGHQFSQPHSQLADRLNQLKNQSLLSLEMLSLTFIPQHLFNFNLQNIHTISLDNNQLSIIPLPLLDIPTLRTLKLHENLFTTVHFLKILINLGTL